MCKKVETFLEKGLVYLLDQHVPSLQTGQTKCQQDNINYLVMNTVLDSTQYKLGDIKNSVLLDTYEARQVWQPLRKPLKIFYIYTDLHWFYTVLWQLLIVYVYKDYISLTWSYFSDDFTGSVLVLSVWVDNNWGSFGCICTQTMDFN